MAAAPNYSHFASAREFAGDDIYELVAAEPRATPAAILGGALAEKVVRVRGAIAYDAEVTCIVTTLAAHADESVKHPAPCGRFCHEAKARPHPLCGSPALKAEDDGGGVARYYKRVVAVVKARSGQQPRSGRNRCASMDREARPDGMTPANVAEWATASG